MEPNGEDNRYAPPRATVSDITPNTADGYLATRSRRLVAGMLDGLLAIGVFWLLSVLTPLNVFAAADRNLLSIKLMPALAGFVAFVLMHGYLLAKRGQTLGKALLGIRIVRSDGSPASLERILGIRYGVGSVLGIIPLFGQIYAVLDCLLIFRKSHQCLHDQIADTIVIRR